MILSSVIFLGMMIFFSRGSSVLAYFLAIEVIFFIFIFFFGTLGSSFSFIWSLMLAVGASVLTMTYLVSSMIFFGSDSQTTFLD